MGASFSSTNPTIGERRKREDDGSDEVPSKKRGFADASVQIDLVPKPEEKTFTEKEVQTDLVPNKTILADASLQIGLEPKPEEKTFAEKATQTDVKCEQSSKFFVPVEKFFRSDPRNADDMDAFLCTAVKMITEIEKSKANSGNKDGNGKMSTN